MTVSDRAWKAFADVGVEEAPARSLDARRRHQKLSTSARTSCSVARGLPMHIESKLRSLALVLPAPPKIPPGVEVPFAWVRVHGDRAYVSGHGPLAPDGSPAPPFGRVGAEVSAEQGYMAARSATLAMLSSLGRELGDLDRVRAWLMVSGMVHVAPGFTRTTNVINGCSDLLLALWGPEAGRHARTAIGVAELPLDLPVVIAAEIALD
jgi:enamine deaminase RidA (YjgF/YER057c/UK114 family)